MKWWLWLLLAVVVAASALGLAYREKLSLQYACYRVGQAAGQTEASEQIAWFEAEPNRDAKLHELVGGWRRGSQTFDLYLAQYLMSADCGDELRREFSGEIGWRTELLPRWASFWSWRQGESARAEFDSLISFLETLQEAGRTRSIGWREVLNLQAMFTLTGHQDLARHLTPTNWPTRFQRWRESAAKWPAEITGADVPFPDWNGPVEPYLPLTEAP